MRQIASAMFALLCLSISVCFASPLYPGDAVLELAKTDFQTSTMDLTRSRVQDLMDHLQLPEDVQSRYTYMRGARFEKAEAYFEANQLSQTVLVAAGSVKIGFAKNCVIISGGEVDIAHAAGVVVISHGTIHVSHGQSLGSVPGLFVTKGSVKIGYATGASVYAVAGAKFSQTGAVTAYNTDIRGNLYGVVTTRVRAPIFRGEPVRPQEEPSMVVSSGESMEFTGARCAHATPVSSLADRLPPSARRELNCPRLDEIIVRCTFDSKDNSVVSQESWSFKGCSRTVRFDVSTAPGRVSISGPIHSETPAIPSPKRSYPRATSRGTDLPMKSLTAAEQKKVARYFEEGRSFSVSGEIVKAREAYAKTFEIDPNHWPAKENIAGLDKRIARADAAAAPYVKRMENGDRTARTLADRGLAYLNAGDVGRGLEDLDSAAQSSIADRSIAIDRAWAYVRANRLSKASTLASELLVRDGRFAEAYEIRAWSNFLQNRPDVAYKDAFSSLVEAPDWTPETFASEKAAYRVIVGYFALRQSTADSQAREWLNEWRSLLSTGKWPDAIVPWLMGEVSEQEMLDVAEALRPDDGGNAAAEAATFAAIERGFNGEWEEGRRLMNESFRKGYSAGYSLALLIRNRCNTLGQAIQFPTESGE